MAAVQVTQPIWRAVANDQNGANPETADLELSFRSAPKTVIRPNSIRRLDSTHNGPSRLSITRVVDDLERIIAGAYDSSDL